MITAKHFKESEFKACSPACSLQDMKQHTMDKLDAARALAGIPFVLNSAYRSPAWERSHGRTGTGAHPHGCGVDIRCNTSANRMKIIQSCLAVGFRRIGIGKTYIHVDDDETQAQNVIWHYYDGTV